MSTGSEIYFLQSAKTECEEVIKTKLLAPSRAVFLDYSDLKRLRLYNSNTPDLKNQLTSFGYVDAQNQYGAMIRSSYLCRLNYKSDSVGVDKNSNWEAASQYIERNDILKDPN